MLRALCPPRRPATKLTQGIKVSCDRLHCRESPPLPKDEEGEAAAAAVAGAAGGPGGGAAAGGASAGGPVRHALLRGGQQALHLVRCLPPAPPPPSPPSLVSLDRVRTSTADHPPQHAFCLFSSSPAPALVARWSCEKSDRVTHVSLESSGSSLIVPKSTRSRSRASSLTAQHRTLHSAAVQGRRAPARRCPSPGCGYAVHSSAHTEGEAQDIVCLCGATFCFTCSEEAHRPVLNPHPPPLAHLHTPIRLLPPIRPNPPRAAPRCPKSHSTGVTAVHGGR